MAPLQLQQQAEEVPRGSSSSSKALVVASAKELEAVPKLELAAKDAAAGAAGRMERAREGDWVWRTVRDEAHAMVLRESGELSCGLLAGIVEDSILQWPSLEEALAAHLAGKLARTCRVTADLSCLLGNAFTKGSMEDGESLGDVLRADLTGILSLTSELTGMDIHPAARIGKGLLIDHGTGVVIGETARIGNFCSLLHGVTLGGTGKVSGDRHPKLGDNVLVGAGASILGNVMIGEGAKIGAAALVLTDIPERTTAVGVPAKVVGRTREEKAGSGMDTACRQVDVYQFAQHFFCPFRNIPHSKGHIHSHFESAHQLGEHLGKLSVSTRPSSSTCCENDHSRPIGDGYFEKQHFLQHLVGQSVAALERPKERPALMAASN